MTSESSSAEPLNVEERAAMRAFLARCDVRLSTMHRVATALLSGAGILVLLPAVERDSVTSVLRALLHGDIEIDRLLLVVAVALSIAMVVILLWMVVQQLTRFYFHASHIPHAGVETFAPRFTLTSLRLPEDELSAAAEAEYAELHAAAHNLSLLVPANANGRRRIDRQLDAYAALQSETERTDLQRADSLLVLAAAKRRSLIDEVVKIEYGMARHVLRLQVVVLRYVKALLVVVITVLATFVTDAAVNGAATVSESGQRWIAATMAIWAPVTIIVVSSPVRWVESLLRAEGAARSTVRNDPEFVQVENVGSVIAMVAWALAFAALAHLALATGLSGRERGATWTAVVFSVILVGAALLRWRKPHVTGGLRQH